MAVDPKVGSAGVRLWIFQRSRDTFELGDMAESGLDQIRDGGNHKRWGSQWGLLATGAAKTNRS